MHSYGFLLGREWRLSVAELRSVFKIDGEIIGNEIWIAEFEDELEPEFLYSIGGTIKIIKFFDEATDINELNDKFLKHLIRQESKKVIFALNLYNFNNQFLKNHKNILKFLKQGLKDYGKGVRFLNKPNQNIKSVVIYEEKLDKNHTDLNAVKISDKKYLIGYTTSVQNFKKYSFRDYERPARDSKSGMLPPKLAQIMINLACEGEKGCTIYDPFCGSGTILMEGLLMGYKVIGSDISEKAVNDSEKNLEWLKKNFEITFDYNLFVEDATKLKSIEFPILPSAIVSEIYLGPPQSKFPTDKEIFRNFTEVEKILDGALKKMYKTIRQGGNIVLAIPFYHAKAGNHFLPNLHKIVSDKDYKIEKFKGLSTDRGSLLYSRKNQIVGREIFKLNLVEK